MKKLFFSLAICAFFNSVFSQADTTPVYLRFPTIPQFTINKAPDSSVFTKDNLDKNKETLFILFSPDCQHCQHETESLLANFDKFKKTQIIMVTHLPYEEMIKFYKDYKIAGYPEIIMGRDPKYVLPVFFKLRNFPSIYVYDKKGKFKKSFEGSVAIDKVAEAL